MNIFYKGKIILYFTKIRSLISGINIIYENLCRIVSKTSTILLNGINNFLDRNRGKRDHLHIFHGNVFYHLFETHIPSRYAYPIFVILLFFFPFFLSVGASTALPFEFAKSLHENFKIHIPHAKIQISFIEDIPNVIFFLFLYPLHTIIVLKLWCTIQEVFRQWKADDIIRISPTSYARIKDEFNLKFNSHKVNGIALFLAVCFALLFHYLRHDLDWWGNLRHGFLAAFSFLFPVSLIWYQLLLHNFKGIISLKLLQKCVNSSEEFRLQVYHFDGAYGYAKFEKITILIFLTSLIHMISIYLMWCFNYIPMGIEYVYFFFLIVFIIFGPLFWFYPVYLTHKQIKKRKELRLMTIYKISKKYDQKLEHLLHSGDEEQIAKITNMLSSIQNVYNFASKISTWPLSYFGRKALIIPYILQVISICLSGYFLFKNK